MSDLLNIEVGDGKYNLIQDSEGRLYCLRHGAAWRDLVGDKLILTLGEELAYLREIQAVLVTACKEALAHFETDDLHGEILGTMNTLGSALCEAEGPQ